MKKFSKLITESKKEEFNMSPLMNPVDWDEVFKPLIDHITNHMDTNGAPSNPLFNKETFNKLKDLIYQVNHDYKEYWKYEIDDGSQESFLQAFRIDADYKDIFDCIQPLMDRTEDIEDYGNFDDGSFIIELTNLKYANMEEFLEDINDIQLKLQMLKVDFMIEVWRQKYQGTSGSAIYIEKGTDDINDLILSEWGNETIRGDQTDNISDIERLNEIKIVIYNKETFKFTI